MGPEYASGNTSYKEDSLDDSTHPFW